MSQPFLVLGDSAVQSLLQNQTRSEILSFQASLATVLRAVSTRNEGAYQPKAGVINRGEQKVLFRSFTSPDLVGTKTIVDPAPVKQADGVIRKDGLHGVLTLLNEQGIPLGVISAEEVTGYRTSLQAVMPFVWRKDVAKIVLFGAGKQALWHLRLALALRGEEVSEITVVNRSLERARALVDKIKKENAGKWKSEATLEVVEMGESDKEHSSNLAELLSTADVVFCTVPSKKVLFPKDHLLGSGPERTNPLITAIGSWQAEDIELDPELVRHAASKSDGIVIADDVAEMLHSTGEGVQSGLTDTDIFELGQVLDWRNEEPVAKAPFVRESLEATLSHGLVVYKSVGVGVTDLISGEKIIELARKKGLGTVIEDF